MCTFFVGDFMDDKFIDLALNEAKKAFDLNEEVEVIISKDKKNMNRYIEDAILFSLFLYSLRHISRIHYGIFRAYTH